MYTDRGGLERRGRSRLEAWMITAPGNHTAATATPIMTTISASWDTEGLSPAAPKGVALTGTFTPDGRKRSKRAGGRRRKRGVNLRPLASGDRPGSHGALAGKQKC